MHNKQFKSVSARLAFLVWVKFSVYGGQVKCRGRALHTLIGRYMILMVSLDNNVNTTYY